MKIPVYQRQVEEKIPNLAQPIKAPISVGAYGQDVYKAVGNVANTVGDISSDFAKRLQERKKIERDQQNEIIISDFKRRVNDKLYNQEEEEFEYKGTKQLRSKGILNRQNWTATGSARDFNDFFDQEASSILGQAQDADTQYFFQNNLANIYDTHFNQVVKHESDQWRKDKETTFESFVDQDIENMYSMPVDKIKDGINKAIEHQAYLNNLKSIGTVAGEKLKKEVAKKAVEKAINGSLYRDETGREADKILEDTKEFIGQEDIDLLRETKNKILIKVKSDKEDALFESQIQNEAALTIALIENKLTVTDLLKYRSSVKAKAVRPEFAEALSRVLASKATPRNVEDSAFKKMLTKVLTTKTRKDASNVIIEIMNENGKGGLSRDRMAILLDTASKLQDKGFWEKLTGSATNVIKWQEDADVPENEILTEYLSKINAGKDSSISTQESISSEVIRQSKDNKKEKDLSSKLDISINNLSLQRPTSEIINSDEKTIYQYLLRSGLSPQDSANMTNRVMDAALRTTDPIEYAKAIKESIIKENPILSSQLSSIDKYVKKLEGLKEAGILDKTFTFFGEVTKGLARSFIEVPKMQESLVRTYWDMTIEEYSNELEKMGVYFGAKDKPRTKKEQEKIDRLNKGIQTLRQWSESSKYLSEGWSKVQENSFIRRNEEVFRGSFMQNPSWTRAIAMGSESVGLTSLALALNPLFGSIYLATGQASQERELARDAGVSSSKADTMFLANVAVISALEKMSLDNFIKGGNLATRVVRDAFGEGITEPSQDAFANLVAKTGYDDSRELTQGLIESFIAGMVSGGTIGAFSPRVSRETSRLLNRAEEKGVDTELISEAIVNKLDEISPEVIKDLNSVVKNEADIERVNIKSPFAVEFLNARENETGEDFGGAQPAILPETPVAPEGGQNAERSGTEIKTTSEQTQGMVEGEEGSVRMGDNEQVGVAEEKKINIVLDNSEINNNTNISDLKVGEIYQRSLNPERQIKILNDGSIQTRQKVSDNEWGEWSTTSKEILNNEIWKTESEIKENIENKEYYSNKKSKLTSESGAIYIPDIHVEEIKKDVGKSLREAGDLIDKTIVPLSTRSKKINPLLREVIKKFEYSGSRNIQNSFNKVEPFIKGILKLKENIFNELDLALKNRDSNTVNRIIKENNLEKEFNNLRNELDSLYSKAKEIGLDLGYLEDYFPRTINDVEGFLNYLRGSKGWGLFREAISAQEDKIQRPLDESEKAELINKLIRGYSQGIVKLIRPGNIDRREIDQITKDIEKFYDPSHIALSKYIHAMNNAIDSRLFFGVKGKNSDETIGAYVNMLIDRNLIVPEHEKKAKEIISSLFESRSTTGIFNLYKNISYMQLLGSPINTITQIQDLAFSLYKYGAYDTLIGFKKFGSKNKITREDIGVHLISEEFLDNTKSGKTLSKILELIGFSKFDFMGKEIFINAGLENLSRRANKEDPKLIKELNLIFGKESNFVLKDLKEKNPTENVKYLLFSELSKVQPISLSEMPEAYVKGGNLRILYMLKSYTLKQLDLFHNDIFMQMKDNPKQALKNLVSLSTLLVAMGAGADTIKDVLLGRKIKISDYVMDNLINLIGFSRYSIYKAKRSGLSSAFLSSILPPLPIVDDLFKDLTTIHKGYYDVKDLKSFRNIPLVGKLYYWWFGGGKEIKMNEE